MDEEEITREGNPTRHNDKPLHGGTTMMTTIQVLCILYQREMDVVPNKEPNTTWIHSISGLQTIH